MISLSDDELHIVIDYAKPLAPRDRSEFLIEVSAKLERYPEIGEGLLSRICREAQRKFFLAPSMHGRTNGGGKYG